MRVGPPANDADAVHKVHLSNAKSGFMSGGRKRRACVAAVVAQIAIDGTVERRERRNEEHDNAVGRENGCDAIKRAAVVFNVLKNVEADTAIGLKASEREQIAAGEFTDLSAEVRLIGIALQEVIDAFGFGVEGKNRFPIEQMTCEVADAAAHLQHAAA